MRSAGYVFSEKDLVKFARTRECSDLDCDTVSCDVCPIRDLPFTEALLYIIDHLEEESEEKQK